MGGLSVVFFRVKGAGRGGEPLGREWMQKNQ